MQPVGEFRRKVLRWHQKYNRPFPWRENITPYRVFIAEVLLQRTNANLVAPMYNQVLNRYPNVESLALANTKSLREMLWPIGIPRRALTLKHSAKRILKEHGGVIPADKKALLELPGVGNYTASAVLIVGFSRPATPIDTNVERLMTRYFGARKYNSIERLTTDLFNCKNPGKVLFAVMDFAALVCSKRKPQHEKCPVHSSCQYYIRVSRLLMRKEGTEFMLE